MKINFKKFSLTAILSLAIVFSLTRLVWGWTNPTANPSSGAGAISVSSGNVGIGTASPNEKLEVVGNIRIGKNAKISATNSIDAVADLLTFNNDNFLRLATSATNGVIFGSNIASYITPYADNTYNFGSTSNRWANMYGVNGYFGGNVGIGTTAPGTKLQVVQDGNALRLQASTAGGAVYHELYNSAGSRRGYIGFGGTSSSIFDIVNQENGSMRFWTNNLERMVINNSGNVGIGTTAPAANLHVDGGSVGTAIRVQGATGYDNFLFFYNGGSEYMRFTMSPGSNLFRMSPINANANVELYGGSSANLILGAGGNERVRVTSAGNVGIGTTNPSVAKLQIADGNVALSGTGSSFLGTGPQALIVGHTGFFDLNLQTNGLNRLTIKDGGNVGIGTTGPVGKLHVTSQYSSQLWGASYWSQSGLDSFTAAYVNNGHLSDYAFHTDTSPAGSYLQLDVGVGNEREFTKIRYWAAGTYVAIWDIQYSDNGTSWSTAYSGWNSGAAADSTIEFGNFGKHRYWRLYKTNAAGGGAWQYEVQFYERAAPVRLANDSGDMFIVNHLGNVGIGLTTPDVNYKITTTAGGIKAENSSASQPAGYFDNLNTGPDIQVATGGIKFSDSTIQTTAAGSSSIVPSGTIIMYGGAAAPSGWLLCDGSAVSRDTYANLFTAISTTFGVGDGSTTFNVPDFRGIFPRGAGTSGKLLNANGTAFAGTLGTYQNDAFQGHYHRLGTSGTGYGGEAVTADYAPGSNIAYGGTGGHQTIRAGLIVSDGTSGTPRTGTETKPANLGITFIIKI